MRMMMSFTYEKMPLVYMKKLAAAIFFCVVLVSCNQVSMDDVSSSPNYSGIIGKQFRVKEDIWALGITTDQSFKKRIDYIVLVSGIGFSGPEVISKEQLNSGSILRVTRILKAKSPMASRMDYVVEVVGSNKFIGDELRIRLSGNVNDQNYGLPESIYSAETSPRSFD